MKKTKTTWLVLLAATACACVYFRSAPQYVSTARIKVENDGGIVGGVNHPEASALPYDPYFIHVNDTPHIQITQLASAQNHSGHDTNH